MPFGKSEKMDGVRRMHWPLDTGKGTDSPRLGTRSRFSSAVIGALAL